MIRFSQLKGQRVLARDSAQVLGTVRRLLLDPRTGRIVALELDAGGDSQNLVEWQAIAGIGPDAVVVSSIDQRRGALDQAEQTLMSAHLELEGKLVLDEAGDAIGTLSDVAFDERTGQLMELEIPGHVMPVERLVAIGPYALIVPVPNISSSPRSGIETQSGRLFSS